MLQKAVDLAKVKGASTWLTVLPLTEHGFALHKQAFHDALALRYGWTPSRLPSKCECGNRFTVEHALSCAKGGFPSHRHNEIRDITASLLTEVCSEVCVEPDLQPVTPDQLNGASANSQDGARLDVSANGVWGGRFQKTYFDVRVFNPLAPSNRNQAPAAVYRKHELEKKRAYQQRIQEVEHSSFTPLVLSTFFFFLFVASARENMPNWPIINCFGVTVARVDNEHRTVALSYRQSSPRPKSR